jgi:hypothetical protein
VKKIERTCVDLVRAEAKEAKEREAAGGAADTKPGDPKAVGGKAVNPGKPGSAAEAKASAPPTADLRVERVLKDNSTTKRMRRERARGFE